MKKILLTLIAVVAALNISAQQTTQTVENWTYQTIDSITVGMNLSALKNDLGEFYVLKVEVRNAQEETLVLDPTKQLKAFYISGNDKVKKLKIYSDVDYSRREKRVADGDRERYGLASSASTDFKSNTFKDVDNTRKLMDSTKEVANPNRLEKIWYLNNFMLKQNTKITGYAFMDYKKCIGVEVEYTLAGQTFVFKWEGITLAQD